MTATGVPPDPTGLSIGFIFAEQIIIFHKQTRIGSPAGSGGTPVALKNLKKN